MKALVVYFSKTDITAKLVMALRDRLAQEPECDITLFSILGSDIVEGRFQNDAFIRSLPSYDVIVFASPTYMGSVSAQFKAFADATSELWAEQELANVYAAGITCGSAANGDQTSTLSYMQILATQHGMLWVGLDSACGFNDKGVNRLGCQLGVTAWSPNGELDPSDAATADYLAQRLINVVIKA